MKKHNLGFIISVSISIIFCALIIAITSFGIRNLYENDARKEVFHQKISVNLDYDRGNN